MTKEKKVAIAAALAEADAPKRIAKELDTPAESQGMVFSGECFRTRAPCCSPPTSECSNLTQFSQTG